ncbi:hypothetical protein XANCAGTX0491_006185 [Xanthoria calcicola]
MPGLRVPLSEEFVVESDSDPSNVSTRKAAKKPAPILRKPNQSAKPHSNPSKKRKYESPNASPAGVSVNHASVSNSRPSQARDESESASHSRSSGSDEEEDESESEVSASDEQTSRGPSATTPSVVPVPAAPYKPPAGFEAATITQKTAIDPQRPFTKEALLGKQIWYITAPASVPISLIKEVSAREVTERRSILSYKNTEYGLIAEPDTKHGENMLLIPSPENNHYLSSGAHIEKSLHLQQLVKRPGLTRREGILDHGAMMASKSHVKMIRRQPQGLRMRYQPFGDQSPDEDTDEAPRFKLPPMLAPDRSPRTHELSGDSHSPSRSKPQMKERKTPKKTKLASGVSEALTLSQELISSHPVGAIQFEKQLNDPISSSPKPSEISDEKAKRRAEKKRKRDTTDGGPSHKSDQPEELSQSMTYHGKQMTTNGVDQVLLDAATPKKKRKKRKSEAADT